MIDIGPQLKALLEEAGTGILVLCVLWYFFVRKDE